MLFHQRARTLNWLDNANLLAEYGLVFLAGDARLQAKIVDLLTHHQKWALLHELVHTGCVPLCPLDETLTGKLYSAEVSALVEEHRQQQLSQAEADRQMYLQDVAPGGTFFIDTATAAKSAMVRVDVEETCLQLQGCGRRQAAGGMRATAMQRSRDVLYMILHSLFILRRTRVLNRFFNSRPI